MRALFLKYPQLKALENCKLFLPRKLIAKYGIMWNDELDIEVETIYEDGETVRRETPVIYQTSSQAVASARASLEYRKNNLPNLQASTSSVIALYRNDIKTDTPIFCL